MPAGLSVEGRFMCHACGPHRAWLNNSYIYFLSWIIFELLGGVLSPHSLPWSHIYVERRQKDAGIAEVLIFLRHSSRVWTAECPPRASWLRQIFRLLLLWAVGWRMWYFPSSCLAGSRTSREPSILVSFSGSL